MVTKNWQRGSSEAAPSSAKTSTVVNSGPLRLIIGLPLRLYFSSQKKKKKKKKNTPPLKKKKKKPHQKKKKKTK
eukprot:NODE_21608_length_744_cov_7.677472.p5 GENE.NODE_21608_length_744_cov_7.677472~~NODE_21608_length_744_cov_7.677472.p5  ORF type:complete len:74 (+),score=41.23 NODE_21608_length_744_cov_7.677472:428-649(+)